MSGFESIFSFFGLLLGIAVANVAGGVADLWRARTETRPGICAPILGLVILLQVTRLWRSFWEARSEMTMTPGFLLLCIAIALPYIFVGQAMYPRAGEHWSRLDDYILANRKVLMGALALPFAISMATNLGGGYQPSVADLASWGLGIGLPLLTMLARRAPLMAVGLAANCAATLFDLMS